MILVNYQITKTPCKPGHTRKNQSQTSCSSRTTNL